jgi:hypothetical protein
MRAEWHLTAFHAKRRLNEIRSRQAGSADRHHSRLMAVDGAMKEMIDGKMTLNDWLFPLIEEFEGARCTIDQS